MWFMTFPSAGKWLVRRDTSRLDDRPPFLDLGPLVGAECFRRELLRWRDHLAQTDETLAHGRVVQRLDNGGVQLCDDVLWRSLGRPNAVPRGEVEARQSGLIHRCNVGRLRQPR